jgi:hypothetical protein
MTKDTVVVRFGEEDLRLLTHFEAHDALGRAGLCPYKRTMEAAMAGKTLLLTMPEAAMVLAIGLGVPNVRAVAAQLRDKARAMPQGPSILHNAATKYMTHMLAEMADGESEETTSPKT